MSWQIRTEGILGRQAVERLGNATVAVFGLGGVGSYAAEALARGGIGRLVLVDGDIYSQSNINRQLGANVATIGQSKASTTAARLAEINPAARFEARAEFYTAQNADSFDMSGWDFIIDAIDMITSKLELAVRAKDAGVPIISCMGTGNKLDPSLFRVGDVFSTSVCPVARVMRRELPRRGVQALPVVWSPEAPVESALGGELRANGRPCPGSLSFVPPVAGMLCAGYVIRRLAQIELESPGQMG